MLTLISALARVIGLPPDSAEALKRDAAEASKDYRKPGRPAKR
jgi:hypothetical protein